MATTTPTGPAWTFDHAEMLVIRNALGHVVLDSSETLLHDLDGETKDLATAQRDAAAALLKKIDPSYASAAQDMVKQLPQLLA
jgi:hypothetical protein